MSVDENIIRIMELRKEQMEILDGYIGHREIAMLENIVTEYLLNNSDDNALRLKRKIKHYSDDLRR